MTGHAVLLLAQIAALALSRGAARALVVVLMAVTWADLVYAQVPREALRYQADLVRHARTVWGMAAPVAMFAAQVHQESGWRAHAQSKFASGLAQFTPDTALWVGGLDPALSARAPLDPRWALRALVVYDRWLWQRAGGATTCDRAAFQLAAYNGGLGWINRERRAAAAAGADRDRWWASVADHCLRAAWACRENRDYPRKILLRWQPLYAAWGPGIDCRGVT